jgi:type II restriction/modification system DNA methylase subunit YeeA
MTPQQFIDKWRKVELKERTASQSHFIDLCHLLGLDDPVTADGTGEWFTFEKGASKSGGGEGWADVWRKDCFAWEYKGKRKDLDAAFEQLRRYAIGLENPPLLIVSDMDTIRIHTNWTNTVQQVHVIGLEDLTDAANRDKLKACFENPEILKPAKTRQKLTEEAAAQFAGIAERLRARGHDGMAVAHFVQRLVFCMFAEDVNLLPNKMFQRMLEGCAAAPENFELHAKTLFGAMRSGGMVGFEKVDWFNGGLFDDDAALPLNSDDLKDLLAATKLDWSDIDPSILGTLFERGLDPAKRSQLGAHYTDRDKIMQIVNPVIIEPLMAEWAGVKAAAETALEKARTAGAKGTKTKAENEAQKVVSNFMEKLAGFRVLDPACGSGNFLYLSLLALKDIEHRAQLEAEAMGLPRGFPRTGPENVLGIELNPYAAELARASVWIGEIQWMRRNGFEASRNPVLRSLNNIECRDAVLNADGSRADWPKADVVVGNPPFLGDKKMIGELGAEYTFQLRRAYEDTPGGVDLVCYWFAKAWDQMETGSLSRAGLVATNSIRGGANREVLRRIVESGTIFEALSDEAWTVEGAAVRVSLVCFEAGQFRTSRLNGVPVGRVFADLTSNLHGADISSASPIQQNAGIAMQGPTKGGKFEVEGSLARSWLKEPLNPNSRPNSDVLKLWANGDTITGRNDDLWIVDFATMPFEQASLYEKPFAFIDQNVRESRSTNVRPRRREYWWQYNEPAPGLRKALEQMRRFIVTPEVSKHRVFTWLQTNWSPDKNLVVILRDDDVSFGLVHSKVHEIWALRQGTSLEDRPRYTSSRTYRTFPFPEGLTPNIPAADYAADPRAQKIAAAAARLNELRENWLNPADLVVRVPEVVPGYPDRILPKDAAAEAILKKRTLTNLYNERPAWLAHAHAALDEAVAEAYGWGEDWRAGKLTEDEILARLFQLNQERAAKEAI